eukprot:15432043-Alexandrium_andersonii.AAC.1
MDRNLGHPTPTEDPRAGHRQDGNHGGHDAGGPLNRETDGENRGTGTGGSFGLLALIGLIISTVGPWHVGWGTCVVMFVGTAASTAAAISTRTERASVGPHGPAARRPPGPWVLDRPPRPG